MKIQQNMVYSHPDPIGDHKLQGNCFEDSKALPGAVWSGVSVASAALLCEEKRTAGGQPGWAHGSSHQNTPQSTGVF
jgi:hypothetical protein